MMRRMWLIATLAAMCMAAGKEKLIWDNADGEWRVDEDEMASADGTIWAKAEPFRDFTASGSLRIDRFLDKPFARGSIILRHCKIEDGEEFYRLTFTPEQIVLNRMTVTSSGRKYPGLSVLRMPTPVGRWIRFKMAVKGERIQIALAVPQKLVMDTTDPNPIAAGRFGFRAERAAMRVKGVKLRVRK